MVPGLPLNFSSLLKEFLTSMVYMGVEVITCNKIYGDGKKVGAGISIPNSLTLPNGL
jgi:hypothetical protein